MLQTTRWTGAEARFTRQQASGCRYIFKQQARAAAGQHPVGDRGRAPDRESTGAVIARSCPALFEQGKKPQRSRVALFCNRHRHKGQRIRCCLTVTAPPPRPRRADPHLPQLRNPSGPPLGPEAAATQALGSSPECAVVIDVLRAITTIAGPAGTVQKRSQAFADCRRWRRQLLLAGA